MVIQSNLGANSIQTAMSHFTLTVKMCLKKFMKTSFSSKELTLTFPTMPLLKGKLINFCLKSLFNWPNTLKICLDRSYSRGIMIWPKIKFQKSEKLSFLWDKKLSSWRMTKRMPKTWVTPANNAKIYKNNTKVSSTNCSWERFTSKKWNYWKWKRQSERKRTKINKESMKLTKGNWRSKNN